MSSKPVACVELGGTTCAVAIATELGSFLWKKKGIVSAVPRPPVECVAEICETLKTCGYDFDVIGIASFGPLNLTKGEIANSPKPLWRGFPLLAEFKKHFPEKKIFIETDVNAPAYSEYLALQGEEPNTVHSVGYLTIGTGVGAGVFSDGKTYHGCLHPEFGHIRVDRYPDDHFEGTCPFHGACLEGLISSGALAQRLGIDQADLPSVPNDDKVWDIFAFYVGQCAATAAMSYSLDKFYVGGGIMTGDGRQFLYEKANEYCKKIINGYIDAPEICPPHYLKDAGLVGAAAVAFHPEVFESRQ